MHCPVPPGTFHSVAEYGEGHSPHMRGLEINQTYGIYRPGQLAFDRVASLRFRGDCGSHSKECSWGMNMKARKSGLFGATLLAIAALTFGMGAMPASAEPVSSTHDLSELAPAISGQAGNVRFDAAVALADGFDQAVVDEFAVGIVAGGGTAVGTEADQSAVDELTQVVSAARASCKGQTGGSTQWYGWQLKINSCQSATLIASIGAGAGVATAAALFNSWTGVGGISARAIAALITAGVGILNICNASGNGMILNLAWTGTPWCWQQ